MLQRVFNDYAAVRFFGAAVISLILCAVGLWYLIKEATLWVQGQTEEGIGIVLLAMAVTAIAPTLFTPLDWGRFYLLPVVFSTVCIAIGASRALFFLHSTWQRNFLTCDAPSKQ